MNMPPAAHPYRQTLVFALLYFSEGAPIGFIWWALPTLLRAEGMEVGRITALTAALALPWTLKFLWAPLVDLWRGPNWDRRHWITTAQLGMGACLVPLVFVSPAGNLSFWGTFLIGHALFAATQDAAIDSLAVESVSATGRGRLNGAMQAGMLLGRSLFGGVSIYVVSRWGWGVVLLSLIGAIWCSLMMLWRWVDSSPAARPHDHNAARVLLVDALVAMVRRRSTWYALGFALAGGAAFEASGALRGPYLIDLGASEESIAWFFSLPSTAAMLIGGLLGGWASDWLGRIKSVAIFLSVVIAGVVTLSCLPAAAPLGTHFAVFAVIYFAIGLFTAASYAMFMDLADPAAAATQFTLFMAATNMCEVWAVWAGGRWTEFGGYGLAFLGMGAVSAVSLLLLFGLARALAAESAEQPVRP